MDQGLLQVILIYLVVINLVTFITYGIDKLKARRSKWRISEATLLGLAVVGGSIGAWLAPCGHRLPTFKNVYNHRTRWKKSDAPLTTFQNQENGYSVFQAPERIGYEAEGGSHAPKPRKPDYYKVVK